MTCSFLFFSWPKPTLLDRGANLQSIFPVLDGLCFFLSFSVILNLFHLFFFFFFFFPRARPQVTSLARTFPRPYQTIGSEGTEPSKQGASLPCLILIIIIIIVISSLLFLSFCLSFHHSGFPQTVSHHLSFSLLRRRFPLDYHPSIIHNDTLPSACCFIFSSEPSPCESRI